MHVLQANEYFPASLLVQSICCPCFCSNNFSYVAMAMVIVAAAVMVVVVVAAVAIGAVFVASHRIYS